MNDGAIGAYPNPTSNGAFKSALKNISLGWSASRLTPRTGLSGTPLGGATTPQQNPIFAAIAKVLGIAPQTGPIPVSGVNYLARAATAGTPAERAADKIATAAETAQAASRNASAPAIAPRSAASSMFSQSGNITLPNSVTRTPTLTPLQSGLAQSIGIAPVVKPSPIIAGTSPQILAQSAPITNTTIPSVTNFNTLANQNQNLPPWLLNAIQNLNSPDNFTPVAPVVPMGGGFDPRIGATMAATEARIAAQQKELAEANKLRIQQAKAEAAAAEHAHELQVQRQRIGGGGINYQSGWGAF